MIVFLRDDIYNQLYFHDKNKISNGNSITLKWDANSLRDLVERRIQSHNPQLTLTDIFTNQIIGSKQRAMEYMIDRTLLRPRDIINQWCKSIRAKTQQC